MKIPTAKEILDKNLYLVRVETDSSVMEDPYTKAMIEFAKIHSELTAKACARKAELKQRRVSHICSDGIEYELVTSINKKTIIKAYPLTNIK